MTIDQQATHQQLRPLPPQHDDPDSTSWVPPEDRERYVTTPVPAAAFAAAKQERQHAEQRAQLLAQWEQLRASKERRLETREYQRWLRTQVHEDGTVKRYALSDLPDRTVNLRDPLAPQSLPDLTAEQVADLNHHLVMRTIASNRARAEREVAERERLRRARTCEVCGKYPADVKPTIQLRP